MLEKETTKHKTIVIFNDGDSDQCGWGIDCFRGEYLMRKHTQAREAKAIHDLGIRVILIAVGPNTLRPGNRDYQNAVRIAGGRENMIPAKDFQSFDTNVLQQVLKELCREVY
ncbi:hypothetical protein Y032_0116g554 [Ancylostoma ceylanicum]|nr:hypothetical protein Y032_0116g554 [Ancylostoma ceylanicum]